MCSCFVTARKESAEGAGGLERCKTQMHVQPQPGLVTLSSCVCVCAVKVMQMQSSVASMKHGPVVRSLIMCTGTGAEGHQLVQFEDVDCLL